MATFVLVHGGWGGGWEWRQVADGLRSRGHEAHTPTLTGLGDRAHLATPAVGLSTHVQDVVATIETLDLDGVVLAGQSYGGMVVTGVVDRIPERIAQLIYLDAFVPEHGVSCNDLCGVRWTTRVRQLAAEEGDGWLVPLPFDGTMGLPDDVAAWYAPRLRPHPLATLDDPADLSGAGSDVPRAFVRFLEEDGTEPDDPIRASARTARESGWTYLELAAPHDLHVSEPERVVDLLEQLVR